MCTTIYDQETQGNNKENWRSNQNLHHQRGKLATVMIEKNKKKLKEEQEKERKRLTKQHKIERKQKEKEQKIREKQEQKEQKHQKQQLEKKHQQEGKQQGREEKQDGDHMNKEQTAGQDRSPRPGPSRDIGSRETQIEEQDRKRKRPVRRNIYPDLEEEERKMERSKQTTERKQWKVKIPETIPEDQPVTQSKEEDDNNWIDTEIMDEEDIERQRAVGTKKMSPRKSPRKPTRLSELGRHAMQTRYQAKKKLAKDNARMEEKQSSSTWKKIRIAGERMKQLWDEMSKEHEAQLEEGRRKAHRYLAKRIALENPRKTSPIKRRLSSGSSTGKPDRKQTDRRNSEGRGPKERSPDKRRFSGSSNQSDQPSKKHGKFQEASSTMSCQEDARSRLSLTDSDASMGSGEFDRTKQGSRNRTRSE